METLETESNYSYNSDSLQSNGSSLSGLSLYGNEFAELRHLVNPLKYPQYEKCITPKPEIISSENHHQELDEKFKDELLNLEQKINLRYHEKFDNLLKTNSRLETELENANGQIERLIKNYKEKSEYSVFTEKLDLERQLHKLNLENHHLKKHCTAVQQEKSEVELINSNLNISLQELLIERDVKNTSISCLKQKVSEQHIDNQNLLKSNNSFNEKLNTFNAKNIQLENSLSWYKGQLKQCQHDKIQLKNDLTKSSSLISDLNCKNADLSIELGRLNSEIDNVRLQALKEKQELFQKLENINLDSHITTLTVQQTNTNFYEENIEELKNDVTKIKAALATKDKDLETLNRENSATLGKCLILQKTLEQKETDLQILENSRKELLRKVGFLNDEDRERSQEILSLRRRLSEKQIELEMRNREKMDVEKSVEVIRKQFLKFKKNYESIKTDLHTKNKTILQLQNEKQELFMNNNWTICELEQAKHKDSVIENLKKENADLVTAVETLTQKVRVAEVQNLKLETIISEEEENVVEFQKQLSRQSEIIFKNRILISDYEEKIIMLEKELQQCSQKYQEMCDVLAISQKQLHIKEQEIMQLNRQTDELENKDVIIDNLKNRLKNSDYLKITDDEKMELLYNKPAFSTKIVMNILDNLNIEEFESTVNIRLKYLDEKLRKVMKDSDYLQEMLKERQADTRIEELEILLQVKHREMQERQKKMDKNNRTLLRKVKEHMRGRNSAEKQLNYLQCLYNDLADENNSCKLSLDARNHEVSTLKDACNRYKNDIDKLKNKVCEKCLEMGNLSNKLDCLETFCEQLKLQNVKVTTELEEYRQKSIQLQNKIEEYDCERMEQDKALKLEETNEKLSDDNQILQKQVIESLDKIEFITKENELMALTLQQTVESSEELESKIQHLDKLIHNLTNEVHNQQNEIRILNNDKSFLKRLSSDLKIALKTYMDHNKTLQDRLGTPIQDRSLPVQFSIPHNYDENYIAELLQKNQCQKPSTEDIQGCLSKLKEEIFSLQDQITKKNVKKI